MNRTLFPLAALALALLASACVTVKEPLVKFDSQGFSSGGTHPDTQVKAGDSSEVVQLKQEVANLQRQLADVREDLAREKAKRKAAEDKLDRLLD